MSAAELPQGIERAFEVAAGELGFAAAAWLFVRESFDDGGLPRVSALRDALGRTFPVLDAVAAAWLDGERAPRLDVDAVLAALGNTKRLVLVGIETDAIDALVTRLPRDVHVALLDYSLLDADFDRVLANYGGRIEATSLSGFHAWGGASSAVLTFLYGHDHHRALVRPAWLRLAGPDVRSQFRALIGWNILPRPLYVYPRWLHELPLETFTQLIDP